MDSAKGDAEYGANVLARAWFLPDEGRRVVPAMVVGLGNQIKAGDRQHRGSESCHNGHRSAAALARFAYRRPKANARLRVTGETPERVKEISMFLALFMILVVMWMLGFFAFHVAGGLIHILLIAAVIALVMHLFRGRSMA